MWSICLAPTSTWLQRVGDVLVHRLIDVERHPVRGSQALADLLELHPSDHLEYVRPERAKRDDRRPRHEGRLEMVPQMRVDRLFQVVGFHFLARSHMLWITSVPRLLVRKMTVFLKLDDATLAVGELPLVEHLVEEVITSGWAFSTSSSSTTE